MFISLIDSFIYNLLFSVEFYKSSTEEDKSLCMLIIHSPNALIIVMPKLLAICENDLTAVQL